MPDIPEIIHLRKSPESRYICELNSAPRITMFRQLPKLLSVAAALLFVAGCQNHSRSYYHSKAPWVSRPAATSDLPVDAAMPPSAATVPPKL